jgi:transcriptional regulator with XRE-family HTH domain
MGSFETGNIISKIRKDKNMTQKELANLLNVTDKAVSKWERGEGYPDVALLPLLSNILGISIDELLNSQNQTIGEQVANKKEEKTDSNTDGQIPNSKEAYKNIIEDYNFKFERNWFFIYFSMVLSFLTGYLDLPFGLNRILPTLLPIFVLCLFCYIDMKHQMTINRLQNYVDEKISKTNTTPYYHMLIFLIIQSIILNLTGKVRVSGDVSNLKLYINPITDLMFYIKIFNFTYLWIIFMKYREFISKFNIFIFANLAINFFLSIVIMIIRVKIRVANPLMEPSFKHAARYIGYPNLIALGIVLLIAISISTMFLRIKDLTLKGKRVLFLISLLINSIILISYNSVEYVFNDKVNICWVKTYNLRNAFLIFIIIYYISAIIYEKSRIQENS